jgi:polysaccharide deacetylase family protein (PEP-CTERM system associated)
MIETRLRAPAHRPPLQGSSPFGRGRVTNALTIDFEDWYQGLEIPVADWGGFEDRILPVALRLLALLADADARATFFVLGYVAERHPSLVRQIAAAGHEIATHGYSHTPVYRQTPAQFRDELRCSIQILEELTQQRVLGHRAPFFSITARSLWALDVLGELGLVYDSSIFPVRNHRYGIEDAPRWPYEVSGGPAKLMEFPITTWQFCGRNLPVAGGAYFRIFPYPIIAHAFRAINRAGRPGVFYLHPWELDPHHPRIPLPARIGMTHYFNLKATEGRLRRLLREFHFAPMREVLGVC